jgi:hypothetical protein
MKNQKQNVTIIIAAVAVLLISGILYYIFQPKTDACDYYAKEEITPDPFMHPLINETFKAKVYPNWYKCHAPQKGVVIRYSLGAPGQEYTRILGAAGGDKIKIIPDPLNRGWNMLVNDDVQVSGKDANGNDLPYVFGVNKVRTTLSLYMNAKDGSRTLGDEEVVMLALSGPGFNDSGLFGLFEKSFVRKVELPDEQQKVWDDLLPTLFTSSEKVYEMLAADSEPPSGKKSKSEKKELAKPTKKQPKKNR